MDSSLSSPTAPTDPDHWRMRANETRRLAAEAFDPFVRQTMEQVAASYDLLADRAQKPC